MLRRNFLFALLPDRFVLTAATLGPIGTRLPAPGTFGSLAGVALAMLYVPFAHPILSLVLTGLLVTFAIPVCGEAEIRLGARDPGEIILDEVVAVPLVFIGIFPLPEATPGWTFILAGFFLFRFFDILKPLGISRLQSLPGGKGVVMDDVAAALAAAIVLNLLLFFEVLP